MVDVDIYLALLEEQCNNRYDAYRIILEKQKEKTIGDSVRKGKRVVEGIRTQIRNASRELTETPSYRLLRRNTLVKNIRTLRASLRNAEKEQGLENRIIESRITRATLNSLQTVCMRSVEAENACFSYLNICPFILSDYAAFHSR